MFWKNFIVSNEKNPQLYVFMKPSVLCNIFSEQGLRIPVAIFNRFTLLVTSQPQEPVQKVPLSPTHT